MHRKPCSFSAAVHSRRTPSYAAVATFRLPMPTGRHCTTSSPCAGDSGPLACQVSVSRRAALPLMLCRQEPLSVFHTLTFPRAEPVTRPRMEVPEEGGSPFAVFSFPPASPTERERVRTHNRDEWHLYVLLSPSMKHMSLMAPVRPLLIIVSTHWPLSRSHFFTVVSHEPLPSETMSREIDAVTTRS